MTPSRSHSVDSSERRQGLLAGMRIRKKLVILHTFFSLSLAVILLLSVRPAIHDIVFKAESHECRVAIELLAAAQQSAERLDRVRIDNLDIRVGDAAALNLPPQLIARARANPGETIVARGEQDWPLAVRLDPATNKIHAVSTRASEARTGVLRLYALIVAALLAVYGLIVLALESLVLPRQVYRPIRMLLRADDAVQAGRREEELIPESQIPSDELGEIMRSRNESIIKLRKHEAALAEALERLEIVANDLKRKNHLLETTRRNMADQDRLVSLGMMSAGLAHELNTPLAVLKGLVERIAEKPREGVEPAQAQLMLRVVRRLERLSDSLLDFARARSPAMELVDVRAIVDEAWTLVRLDREVREVSFVNDMRGDCAIIGDADRLTQVFVNILR
ncbi:MAG: histidine kinase dimerization/phospho-acceptor domain-containing protein, partial [Planctomycetota bacterium]|nr:histidine kinase dimerization/phospho-acceptor domain-containing protein [Planctomycetota bacterium]